MTENASMLDRSIEFEEGKENSNKNNCVLVDVDNNFSKIKWLHFSAFIFMGIQVITDN